MDKQTYISLAPLCRSAAEAQAARYVHDEAEREDIVQDVLLKMWEQHELLQSDPQKLKAYAATLARNICLEIPSGKADSWIFFAICAISFCAGL